MSNARVLSEAALLSWATMYLLAFLGGRSHYLQLYYLGLTEHIECGEEKCRNFCTVAEHPHWMQKVIGSVSGISSWKLMWKISAWNPGGLLPVSINHIYLNRTKVWISIRQFDVLIIGSIWRMRYYPKWEVFSLALRRLMAKQEGATSKILHLCVWGSFPSRNSK